MLHQRSFELNTPVNAADHVRGPDAAPVTLVEYGDFGAPTASRQRGRELLLIRFEGRIRFAYRHFPLEEFHPHARRAAEASECAGAQGKFWEMHDVLFSNQLRLQEYYLRDYARDLRLDIDRFVVDMRDSVYLPRVHEHQRSGSESGVRSTPGFFIMATFTMLIQFAFAHGHGRGGAGRSAAVRMSAAQRSGSGAHVNESRVQRDQLERHDPNHLASSHFVRKRGDEYRSRNLPCQRRALPGPLRSVG